MSIGEEQVECPLCMEPLEMDDINFYPCTCGYQICRFCWNRIRTDENGLCPACRKSYPEDPAAFKPLTEDELQRIKRERKMKDLQRKQKAAENRKHLANVRVVQKNLVFAVGLSQRLADTEVLKKHDYFGKFGKIVKVVINQSTSYAGSQCSQGPSASAYITYHKAEDALRAIQAVNNIHVDGRTIKASLGTTKYCSHFLRGTQCPKPDCMYLHELGDEAASFTKEEMQQGKHQEYEQKLYEQYMNHLNTINATNQTPASTNTSQQNPSKPANQTRKKTHSPASTQRRTPPLSASQNHTQQQQHSPEAWPSLTTGQTQSKSSTDSRTTNGNKGPPTSHSSSLSNSFGSTTTLSSNSSSSTGATHKRNLSSDLQHSSNNSRGSSGQRQTRTPDPHTANRAQNPALDSTSSQPPQTVSQQSATGPPPHQQQNNSQPPPPRLLNNSTPPSQLSPPPQIHTPPTQIHRHTQQQQQQTIGSPKSPHPIAPQRKPLYGNSNTESLSLFSNSGFAMNRHTIGSNLKPQQQQTVTNAAATSGEESQKLNGPEVIPDTISVSSSTDWQAAFGFQPSMLSSRDGLMAGGHHSTTSNGSHPPPHHSNSINPTSNNTSSHSQPANPPQQPQQVTHGQTGPDPSTDDDLGFDPWNESTKALQDLIEKEAVTAASGQNQYPPQHNHHQQQPPNAALPQRYPPSSTHSQQMLAHEHTNKPLPPGFNHSHINPFTHNPLLSGSRMAKFLPGASFSQNGLGGGGGGAESLPDLSLLGAGGMPPQPGMAPPADSFSMKSWQEGFRALLPNINIHFSNPQAGGGGGPVPLMNNPPAAGASGLPQQHHNMQASVNHKPAQKSPKNSWDLTCDPAIVTSGNIAEGPEEPHWMASLHHLTEDTTPSLQQQASRQNTNNPYNGSRFLPFRQPQHTNNSSSSQLSGSGLSFPSQPPTAPPPGFQNTVRPPPHLTAATPAMLHDSHKQLMDAFQ